MSDTLYDDGREAVEIPSLNPEDKEIIADLLFPVFQDAVIQNRNLSRTVLREILARYFFPWIHVREVLDELEEKDYVSLLTTRGGGIFTVGQKFHLWQEEMRQAEDQQAGVRIQSLASPLNLDARQVKTLATFIKSLAAATPSAENVGKVRLAAVETEDAADFITSLIKD